MEFTKGIIETVDVYMGFKIVVEHNLNIFENTKETEEPIHTICGMGRTYKGSIKDVRRFIDKMIAEYGN